MNVDKFYHHINKRIKTNNSTEQTLILSGNGFDAQNKVIENVGKPTNACDCATKEYVDKMKIEILKNIVTKDYLSKLTNDCLSKIKTNSQYLTQLNSDLVRLKSSIETLSEKSRKK